MKLQDFRFEDGYDAGQNFGKLEGRSLAATISVGGYRWDIIECEGQFVAAFPKSSKDRGRGTIYKTTKGFDHGYYCFSMKLSSAANIVAAVLLKCNSVEELYKATSVATCRCAICGANLTDDLSVSRGIGPECWKKFYTNKAKVVARVIDSRITA